MFYVYEIRNIKNNKVYVGKAENVLERWKKHISVALCKTEAGKKVRQLIHRALVKDGKEQFKLTVLEEFESEKECFEAEIRWIATFKSNVVRYGPNFGYNLTDGGEGTHGHVPTEETRKKISEALSGRKLSEETKKKMSEVTKERMTPEYIIKISEARKGIVFAEEHKTNLSKAIKKWHNDNPFSHPMFGKHHIEEVKIGLSGENSVHAKLSLTDVIEIRRRYEEEKISQQKLGDEFGVSRGCIRKIVSGESWAHLPGAKK